MVVVGTTTTMEIEGTDVGGTTMMIEIEDRDALPVVMTVAAGIMRAGKMIVGGVTGLTGMIGRGTMNAADPEAVIIRAAAKETCWKKYAAASVRRPRPRGEIMLDVHLL